MNGSTVEGNLPDVSDQPKYLIYGLVDPRNGELRYVGKSCSGIKRPRQHAHLSCIIKNKRTHTTCWVKSLLVENLKPDIEILEVLPNNVSRRELSDTEIWYIAYFKSIGCRLTNHTIGGEGMGGHKASDETKFKMSNSHKGKHQSSDVCGRIARARLGMKFPERHRKRIAKSHRGCRVIDETGRIHECAEDAARYWGLSSGNVGKVARGIISQTGGHVFKYMETL